MPLNLRSLWTSHRRLAIAGIVVTVLVAVVAVLHAPFVRTRVAAFAVERLRADAGIDARIDGLDYNLLALRVSLGPTTLAAEGHATPFLTVDGIEVDAPWSVVSGTIALQSLTITNPVISITRDADGQLNLPAAADPVVPEPEPTAIGPIEIDALSIRNLVVSYQDAPLGLSVDGRAMTLDLARRGDGPLAGQLTMEGGVEITSGDRRTRVSRLDGDFSFDGSSLGFDAFTLEAPELTLQLDGRVDLLAAAPSVDTRYEGRMMLGPLVPWLAPGEEVAGVVSFAGAVTGPLDAPEVTLTAASEDLAWRDQRGMTLDLRAAMSPATATVERLRFTVGGGAVEGTARVGLDEAAAGHLELTWNGLDLGSLAATAGVTEPRVAAVASGRANADWSGSDPATAVAAIQTSIQSGRAPAGALALSGGLAATLARGEWTATLDRLATRRLQLNGRASGRLNADDIAATTIAGNVRGTVDDLPALVRELAAAGLVTADTSSLRGGRAALDVTLAGTVGAPSASGSLEATEIDVEGVAPGRADRVLRR